MFKYIARGAAIIFFLLGLVGSVYIVRILYGAYQQSDIKKEWLQIPSPDERLITLKIGDAGEIFADGENGGLYLFSAYPELEWKKINSTENPLTGKKCTPVTDDIYKIEPMPSAVKMQVSVDCGPTAGAIYINVDLLENGETWYSRKTSNSLATVGLFVLTPIYIIIDLIFYITSIFFLALDIIITFRRKSRQAVPQKI